MIGFGGVTEVLIANLRDFDCREGRSKDLWRNQRQRLERRDVEVLLGRLWSAC